MATASFAGTDFRVFGDGNGFFPLPRRDVDGIPHYQATILLASAADYASLADAMSLVTVKRALGSFGFVVEVEAGPSSDDLEVPVLAGTQATFTALLVGLTPRASGKKTTDLRAEADWIVVGDVTPS